jgi:ABC-type lipoprotein export system ATPase subunit
MTFQDLSDLRARENVVCSPGLAGRRDRGARADAALAGFGFERHAGHRPSGLSGGAQQRVAIVAAAGREAPLVLAGEPTGELDAGNERVVFDSLARLRELNGATIVVETHSYRLAEAADCVVSFCDGRATRS